MISNLPLTHPVDDLLLHEVEAHGEEGDTEYDVAVGDNQHDSLLPVSVPVYTE